MNSKKFIIKEITNSNHNVKLLYGITKVETICSYVIEYTLELSNGLHEIIVPSCKVYQSGNRWLMSQKKINGDTLRQYLINCTDVPSITYIFDCILENILMLYNNSSTICVDMNLENFIIKNNTIHLIDVIPPILLDKVQDDNLNNDLLYNLFCDRNYHLTAFLYYILKTIILNKQLNIEQKKYACFLINKKFDKSTDIIISNEYLPFNTFIDDLFKYLFDPNPVNYVNISNNSFMKFYNLTKKEAYIYD